MQRLMRYGFILPAAFICIKPSVANANCIPKEVKQKIEKLNQTDRAAIVNEQKENLAKWWLGTGYQAVIYGLNDDIIKELDYIRVMYGRPPLDARQRVVLRRTIVSLIERGSLSHQEYDFLMYVLAYYNCI